MFALSWIAVAVLSPFFSVRCRNSRFQISSNFIAVCIETL